MAKKNKVELDTVSAGRVNEIFSRSLDKLKEVTFADSNDPRLFFPNGIDLISITVSVANVELAFKVSGKAE
ncbi:MAG: hypothetical protein OEQ53_05660 [Saprospiraceae bacterium]|nr:hypothetical protein [Saprospiraceae bacterium]